MRKTFTALAALLFAASAWAGIPLRLEAVVVIDPVPIPGEFSPTSSCGAYDFTYVILVFPGNGNAIEALCTLDSGHEALCECASWEAGDVVRILEASVNGPLILNPASAAYYWIEIDRAERVEEGKQKE